MDYNIMNEKNAGVHGDTQKKKKKGKVLLININGMTIFKSHYLIQAGVIDGCANGAGRGAGWGREASDGLSPLRLLINHNRGKVLQQ